MERFWLWIRRNLDTEQIMKAVHVQGTRQQAMLAEMETFRAAIGDLRQNLDMPPMVEMDDINENRTPSGDPTGL